MRTLTLVVFAVALAAACGKSRKAMLQDVEICSGIVDARSIAHCLRDGRGWDSLPAESAGARQAFQLDSLRRWQEDSAWNLDAARHVAELRRCAAQPDSDMATCLRLAGWPGERATHAADSVWNRDAAEHRRQIQACVRAQRTSNIADCLMLWYRWGSVRALAANDSVQRARITR